MSQFAMLRTFVAGTMALACTVALGQNCIFRTSGNPIIFPPLDQSSPVTVSAFSDIEVRCTPTSVSPTWTISGANGSAPLRLKHSTLNTYIPYSATTLFLGAQGSNESWRITGTILGANYQNAVVGTYSDVLSATVLP